MNLLGSVMRVVVVVVVLCASYGVCKSFFAKFFLVKKEFFGKLIVFHVNTDSKTFLTFPLFEVKNICKHN